jgi:hypothetical protein
MECIQEHINNNRTGVRLIGDDEPSSNDMRRVPIVKLTERNPNKIDELEKEIINMKSKIRYIERRIEFMETNLIHPVLDTVVNPPQIKSRDKKKYRKK